MSQFSLGKAVMKGIGPRALATAWLVAYHAGTAEAGGALLFHRDEGDFARVPHAAVLSFGASATATFELWMMPTEDPLPPEAWHVLGKRGNCWNNSDLNYQCARDGSGFCFGTAYCGPCANPVPPVNQWTHVALSCDGRSFRLYLNGVLTSQYGVCTFQGENAADLIFGGSDGCGSTFAGYLDEIRIWNYARSAEEIEYFMSLALDDPLPGLVGCWHFDEAEGSQQILDSSGLGNHGTLGGDGSIELVDPERVVSTAPLLTPPSAVPSVEWASWGRVKGGYR